MGRGDKRTTKGARTQQSCTHAQAPAYMCATWLLTDYTCFHALRVAHAGKRKAKSFGNSRPRNAELRKRSAAKGGEDSE